MLKDGTTKEPMEGAEDADLVEERRVHVTLEKIKQAFSKLEPMSANAAEAKSNVDRALQDHLGSVVNGCIGAVGLSKPLDFHGNFKALLRRSWILAESLQSDVVTPLHLVAALAAMDMREADGLVELAKVDGATHADRRGWLQAGALIRQSVFNRSAARPTIEGLVPDLYLLEWISEAGRVALSGPTSDGTVHVEHLISALRSGKQSVRDKIKRQLHQAAVIGRTPAEFLKARQDIDSNRMTLGYFRTEHRKRVSKVRARVIAVHKDLKRVSKSLEAMGSNKALTATMKDVVDAQRGHRTALEALTARLKGLESKAVAPGQERAQTDVAPVVEAIASVGQQMRADLGILRGSIDQSDAQHATRLTTLEAHAADIKRHLAPPSAVWLAASVLVVLALGVGAGLMMVP